MKKTRFMEKNLGSSIPSSHQVIIVIEILDQKLNNMCTHIKEHSQCEQNSIVEKAFKKLF